MSGGLDIPMLPDSKKKIKVKAKEIKHKIIKTKLEYKEETGKSMRKDPVILIGDVQKGNSFEKVAISFRKEDKYKKFVSEHEEDILEKHKEGKGKNFYGLIIGKV